LVMATLVATPAWLVSAVSTGNASLGILSVFCSGMIYVDTRRPFWRSAQTFPRFFGTALQGGAAILALLLSLEMPPARPVLLVVAWLALLFRGAFLLWEGSIFARALANSNHPLHRSMRLIWTQCRGLLWLRCALVPVTGMAGVGGLLTSGLLAASGLALAL